jgi:putative endonuclease
MSYYSYVLYSPEFNRFYKGHCESLNNRIKQHNAGFTKSTKPFIPWNLIWYEEFESRDLAIQREKYLKTAAGRKFLKTAIIDLSVDLKV